MFLKKEEFGDQGIRVMANAAGSAGAAAVMDPKTPKL